MSAPKNALSPASIFAPDAQMGFPATSPEREDVQALHETGSHEASHDEPQHKANE